MNLVALKSFHINIARVWPWRHMLRCKETDLMGGEGEGLSGCTLLPPHLPRQRQQMAEGGRQSGLAVVDTTACPESPRADRSLLTQLMGSDLEESRLLRVFHAPGSG